MQYRKCVLPAGYIDEAGEVHKETELRALTGREEELLVESDGSNPAARVSSLIARCVRRIGTLSPITEEIARDLLVGDRQCLMLKLREATFGDRVEARIACPWPDCGERIDIDFKISEVPVRAATLTTRVHDCQLSAEAFGVDAPDAAAVTVHFRLPNGGDQEALAFQLAANEAGALTMLLWRCIERIGDTVKPSVEQVRELPAKARLEIEAHMQALAPDAELTMDTSCPQCGRVFSAPFDLQEFFFGELRTSRDLLQREVHYLAYNYHWSEQEIMSMTRDKRREYIEVLADEIERLNERITSHAVG